MLKIYFLARLKARKNRIFSEELPYGNIFDRSRDMPVNVELSMLQCCVYPEYQPGTE
jgi:hypothetical protein